MSDLVERLAAKWGVEAPDVAGRDHKYRENVARWWLNAIAEELGASGPDEVNDVFVSYICADWLRREAGE